MESLYWVLLATVVFLIIIKLLKYPHVKTNLPPGPPKWPLIGNLNLIGPLSHQSLHKLSQTYGKLMHLTFGSSPVVVASSPDMAKLFLKTYDHIFASRPSTQAGKYTNYNSKDLIWSPFGDFWNQGRKIFLEEIFSMKKLDSFEHIRVEERNVFLSSLHKFSGEQIVLKDHIFRMTLSVICRIALGRKYFSESKDEKEIMTVEEIENMLDEFFVLNGALNLGDWLPWLRFMDVQGYVKRMKALGKRFDRFNEYVLEDHKERMKSEGDGFEEKDIVDVLLKLAHDPTLEVKLDYDCVKAFTQDLIIGGTDTTTTTLEWAMSELIRQPHLMNMATEELDRVIGEERWVLESDFPNLPFIDSIIKETMRLHPAAVFLAPHLALEDCKVDVYDIAKNTTIFVNTWSIGRDPDLWDDPESFQPKRFMGSDIDVKGHHFELLPFGSGRRMCPGYRLGMKTMRSLLGNMLQGFNWKLHESVKIEDVNAEELYGLSTKRKFPLVVIPEPRLPAHMYN